MATSLAPVVSFMYRTRSHVSPPLLLRKRPRSSFGPQAWPIAAAKTIRGLRGWMTMREKRSVSVSPRCVHVAPPSVLR